MKRVLVITYSQTGQLSRVVENFAKPLVSHPDIEVTTLRVEPETPYPFPWPFIKFFTIFPESVVMDPPPMKPFEPIENEDFDLIILSYQAWFLSPSLPITGFLKSDLAGRLLKGKPVVTLIACRGMWLSAQEKMKAELARLQARLIDNVVLVDEAGSAFSFLATPLWMFTGTQGPWGPIPRAGVAEAEIKGCSRFGERLAIALASDDKLDAPVLTGMGAVTINEKLIAGEMMAHRSFKAWSRILRALGPQDSFARRLGIYVYITFLVTLILTVIPISALIKALLNPFTRERTLKQKHYYALPSGE